MEHKTKKSGLARFPAVGLSTITFFASILLAFLSDRISSTELAVFSTTKIIPMIIYVTVIAGASFFICRAHPKSIWHTPFICNALGVMIVITAALDDSSILSNPSFWIVLGGCILLSVTGSIIGAQLGQKKS